MESNVKSTNVELIEAACGKKIELVDNEQSLPMSQKRKEKIRLRSGVIIMDNERLHYGDKIIYMEGVIVDVDDCSISIDLKRTFGVL